MPMNLVTNETGPAELAADTRNKWWQIGKEYYQTEGKDGITLEIFHVRSGVFEWSLYDDNSPDPDMAVIKQDKPTLAESLADAYDYLDGNYVKTENGLKPA